MATEFKLPDLGEGIESGDIISILVQEGDEIAVDQSVVEIETDKATVEVPSNVAGRIAKVHVSVGDTVPVGGVLVTVEEGNGKVTQKKTEALEEIDESASEEKADAQPKPERQRPVKTATEAETDVEEAAEEEEEKEPELEPQPAAKKKPAAQRNSAPVETSSSTLRRDGDDDDEVIPAGPATRRLARELGVDLSTVTGTGQGGRITREDVMTSVRESSRRPAARASTPSSKAAPTTTSDDLPSLALPGEVGEDAYGPIRRERMSKIRKTIATNMARSASVIPHVTNFDDADITELNQIRKESIGDYLGANIKLTMMPFLMRAVSHSLKLHPMINASLDMDEGEAVFKDYVNLGIAVDTDRGLVVPVVKNADQLSIPQMAKVLSSLAEAARTNRFAIDDLRGGTFTISNLGAIGGTYSTPIINYPEVAVLLVGRSRKLPVVVDDEIKVRFMMPLSLSYDHRLVDGATAARFLNEVIALLEAPGRLLLAP